MTRRISDFVATVACTVLWSTILVGSAGAAPAEGPGGVVSVGPLSRAAQLPGAAALRLVYESTTVGGSSTEVGAAVYLPFGEPPAGGWPVIAWAHGTVGLADGCAYSIAGPPLAERDWSYLGSWLARGYAIVASDYAGLGGAGEHPYLNGEVEAHNVVDSVAAAVSAFPGLSRAWVVVGQSQGAGAAVTTARYATEFGGAGLDYRGAVATGTPAYVEDVIALLGPSVPPVALGSHTTAYALLILNGLMTTYPELDVESFLTESGRTWVKHAQNICASALSEQVAEQRVVLGDLLSRPLLSIPDIHALLTRYMGLPVSGFDRPLFFGQGLRDNDVILPQTLRYLATLSGNRQPAVVHTYPTDHDGTLSASLPDSIRFVDGLFGH